MFLYPNHNDSCLLTYQQSVVFRGIVNNNHMEADECAEEKALLKKLENKDIRAFKHFYKKYSGDLLILGYCLLENSTVAIKLVDVFFERLWIEERFGEIDPPIHKFLYSEFKKGL